MVYGDMRVGVRLLYQFIYCITPLRHLYSGTLTC